MMAREDMKSARSISAALVMASSALALTIAPHAHAETCPLGANGGMNQSFPAKANGVVEIENIEGSVRVVGWGKPEVNAKGNVEAGCQVDISPSADRTRVRIVCPHHGGHGADLEIHVPAASAVEVKTITADASVRDVTGAVRIESVSGDIGVTGAPAEIAVRTTSGEVTIDASSAVTRVRSISGDLHIHGVRGKASIESVSGECQLTGAELSEAEIRSVSGEVTFEGALVGQGSFEFKSHSGDVVLRLPASTNADFELRSFSGDLTMRLGGTHSATSALDVRAGSGGAKVRVRTFSGDVLIEGKK